mgnify:CR=1 FL=1
MNKHVLVIANTDSDDLLSLEKARDITFPLDASVEVVKFVQYTEESSLTPQQYLEQAEQALCSSIQSVFNDTSNITTNVVNGDNVADWVVERCNKKAVDLVIKGGHRSESLFHTPCDWQLIRHLHCPILIASHVSWKTKANILLALDLSTDEIMHQQLNSLILSWGDTWAKATHSELHAVYSIPIAKPMLDFDVVDKQSVKRAKAPAAQEKMDDLLSLYNMSSITSHIIAGPPDRMIPHQANELYSDLVIIGSVGREGVSNLLLGNTAEKVLHHLRTDCLIIKLSQD